MADRGTVTVQGGPGIPRPSVYADVPKLREIRAAVFDSDEFSQDHVDVFDRLLEEAGYSLDDVRYPEPLDDPNEGIPWPT